MYIYLAYFSDAPWCTHCIHMDKDYKKAATDLIKEIPSCKLAKLDGDSNPKTIKRFHVKGYPTFYFWKNNGGHKSTYNGKLISVLCISLLWPRSS